MGRGDLEHHLEDYLTFERSLRWTVHTNERGFSSVEDVLIISAILYFVLQL